VISTKGAFLAKQAEVEEAKVTKLLHRVRIVSLSYEGDELFRRPHPLLFLVVAS
jgi:hypothetical protein